MVSFFPIPIPRRISIVLLGLLSCSAPPDKARQAFYSDSTPKYVIEYDEAGKKHGREEWWHPNGKPKFQGYNHHGERHGEYSAWYPEGGLWYRGYADLGRKDSTLTYWHPNGNIKAVMTYDQGQLVSTVEYDLQGRRKETAAEAAARRESEIRDSLSRAREADLKVWVLRVRKTVEGYWHPPDGAKVGKRAVARITVDRDGRILKAGLEESSSNARFNRAALRVFKRIKKFPPLPRSYEGPTISIQYDFVPPSK